MRQLTSKQKKLLNDYITTSLNHMPCGKDVREEAFWCTFCHKCHTCPYQRIRSMSWQANELPTEVYKQLKAINDTEILYQEITRYVVDHVAKITL
jgi:hypothetical protein